MNFNGNPPSLATLATLAKTTKTTKITAALWLLLNLAASQTLAKTVTFEWEPIKRAVGYELRVEKAGKVHVHRHLSDSQHQADLEPGVYFWKLRAEDRLKRPGRWSESQAIVVMAKAPELQLPESHAEIEFYKTSLNATFKWKPIPGVTRYGFELKNGMTSVFSTELSASEVKVPALRPGTYSWRVRAILVPGAHAPAAYHGKSWDGPHSEFAEVTLKQKKLNEVKPLSPVGVVSTPATSRLLFNWTAVEGAEVYEIRLKARKSGGPGQPRPDELYTSAKTSLIIDLKDAGEFKRDGLYTWEVRPLHSPDQADVAGRTPASVASGGIEAPRSTAEFELSPLARDQRKHTALEFASFVSPTAFHFSAPDSGFSGNSTGTALGLNLSMLHSSGGHVAFSAQLENRSVTFSGKKHDLMEAAGSLRYRLPLAGFGSGWVLTPHLGVALRQYLGVYPETIVNTVTRTVTITGISDLKVSTLGLTSGFDLKRYFFERWTVQLHAAHYLPLAKVGSSEVSALAGGNTLSNYQLGTHLGREFGRAWTWDLGLSYEQRSLNYQRVLSTGAPSSKIDESTSGGFSILGGLIYTLD
ncbi:MAG: hypothetical protein H7222_13320 [Methylotenera sp.]|nr:hypothetical protein [Oligoflexia bacterium]